MKIIDSQVHILDEDKPERPWDPNFGAAAGKAMAATRAHFTKGAAITTDAMMLAAMDRVGVDAALLVATSHYGWDNGYSIEAAHKAPDRFGVIGRIDPAAADVEERVAAWKADPAGIGLRILILSDQHRDQLASGYFDRLLVAAQVHAIPMTVFPAGYLPDMTNAVERFPDLQWVVDHLGIAQPPLMTPDPEPLQRLPELLALARYPNVAVKISAAPALSRETFPFIDLWPALHQLADAFGIDRLMWGSDWTRVESLFSYSEGLRYILESKELSEGDKEKILGGSLSQIFGWTPAGRNQA
ncbi:amidohydrolase family protein [Sphingomonas sp.]|uniref:amidohydrolase family protein n=1 Tax=Sphingomonas sp. TaxID=28214 RepID=UPI003D6D3D27